MDSHIEVVLDYVTDLAEKSGKTVWYEIPNTIPPDQMIIFITDDSKVGCAVMLEKKLSGFIFDKDMYDWSSNEGMELSDIYKKLDTFTETSIPEMGKHLVSQYTPTPALKMYMNVFFSA